MLALVIKATLLLTVALVAVRLARRVRASLRHAMLLAALAMLLALPVGVLLLPAFELAVLPAQNASAGAAPRDTAAEVAAASPDRSSSRSGNQHPDAANSRNPERPLRNPETLLAIIWAGGTLAVLVSLAVGIIRVQHLRRSALPSLEQRPLLTLLATQADVRAPVDLVVHEALRAPITCGVFRQSVLLPIDVPEWRQPDVARALVHELEHVKRHDWATHVAARAVCALYWFHPLVWMAYRQLCLEAEHACDDAVVAREENTMYAEQLVTLARRMAAGPAVAVLGMAHRSDLAVRVAAVLDDTKARGRTGVVHGVAIAVAALALVIAVAPMQLVAAPGEPLADASSTTAGGTSPAVQGTSVPAQSRRTARFERAIVEAADEGALTEVRDLLDDGANVNATVAGDGSPLIVAAREGHLDLVRLLIERGADVNLPVPGDGAPLIMAAREGHVAIVQLLLDRGADVDAIVPGDENALIQSAGAGHLEVVQLLVSRGANVNARAWAEEAYQRGAGEWRTPLSMARRGGHRHVEAFLRARGAIE